MALDDRLLPSEAIDLVGRLIDMFPNGGSTAGGGYLGALAALLVTYPRSVAVRCCDPTKGVARETKFLPTVADLVAFCERETEDMRGAVDRSDREASILRQMQARREAEERGDPPETRKDFIAKRRAELGPTWGIASGKPRPPTREESRAALIAQIGQEAFDAMPDAGYDWTKLKAPPIGGQP